MDALLTEENFLESTYAKMKEKQSPDMEIFLIRSLIVVNLKQNFCEESWNYRMVWARKGP